MEPPMFASERKNDELVVIATLKPNNNNIIADYQKSNARTVPLRLIRADSNGDANKLLTVIQSLASLTPRISRLVLQVPLEQLQQILTIGNHNNLNIKCIILVDPTSINSIGDLNVLNWCLKSDAVKTLLAKVLKNKFFMFETLNEEQKEPFIMAFESKSFTKAGEEIIKEGDKGDFMYIVEQGTFEAHVKGKGLVATMDKESLFGELALIYDAPRAASIVLKGSSAKTWRVNRQVFRYIASDQIVLFDNNFHLLFFF